MKKSFRLLITIACFVSVSSVYGQWTTSAPNVVLTTPTNNVIVGPTPATPTNLYLNSTTIGTTTLSIDNSYTNSSGPTSRNTQLNFNSGGVNLYKMYYSTYPGCGSGMFHISPATSGAGIHFGGNSITFSDNPQGMGCGNAIGTGKYVFDGMIGTGSGINIGYTGQGLYPNPPSGYKLTNSGTSFFRDKVVIGTTNTALPTGIHKLYVGGSIICEELVVKLQANWPDYVFSPSYKLKPLSEVKSYIAENKHLPNVPAACEIEENGVATGEMLTIQMKKIEELTLYLIQMEEENKNMQKANEALLKRVEVLESK